MNYIKLSKDFSFALRHAPWFFELEMDEEGFVYINQLLAALNETKKYQKILDLNDVYKVLEVMEKERFEISGDKIRALYGHSIPMKIKRALKEPPKVLYHGTSHQAVNFILKEGLKPMDRQYVHLSTDEKTAISVGRRRDENPVLFAVDAYSAYKAGISFYEGNESVWLCDEIPPQYLRIIN